MFTNGNLGAQCIANPDGLGWVIVAFNIETRESMIVSKPIDSLAKATERAKNWVGIVRPFDLDIFDQHLSERLGF